MGDVDERDAFCDVVWGTAWCTDYSGLRDGFLTLVCYHSDLLGAMISGCNGKTDIWSLPGLFQIEKQ